MIEADQSSTNRFENIVIVACNHVSGGVDTFLRTLIRELESRGSRVELFINETYPDKEWFKSRTSDLISVCTFASAYEKRWFVRIGTPRRNASIEKVLGGLRAVSEFVVLPLEIRRMRRTLKIPKKSKILVVNGGYPGSLATIAAALALSKHHRVLMNVHNFASPRRLILWPFDWLMDIRLRQRVKTYIGVSHGCTESLRHRLGNASVQLSTVYNAVERRIASNQPALPRQKSNEHGSLTLGLIGTLEHRKGHMFALELLAHLQSSHSSTKTALKFVGADPFNFKAELETQVNALNLRSKVSFVGYLSVREEVYADIDVVLVPSYAMESFCLVAIEALEQGIPVVASSVGALPEILADLPNCLIVESHDVQDWSDAIFSLVSSREGNLEAITPQKLERFFNATTMAMEYLKIMQRADSTDHSCSAK